MEASLSNCFKVSKHRPLTLCWGVFFTVFLSLPAFAQSISVGTAPGSAGGTVDLSISFTAGSSPAATDDVSGMQFDLTLPATLSYGGSVTTGAAASAAGKSASASQVASSVRVIIFGLNQTAIGSGAVATVRLAIAANAPTGSASVGVTGLVFSDPLGTNVPGTSSGGSVSITGVTDTTAPVLSSISSGNLSQSRATISWSTNEGSDTQVDYGLTVSYGSSSSLNTALVTSHTVNLTGLQQSQTYNYRVKSRDAAGNLATSGNFTFTTQTLSPPQNLRVQ